MKNIEHPLVVAYLEAVAREGAALAPERRNELLADLTEHIAVAFAQEGETTAPPVSKWHSLAPLILPPVAGLLMGVSGLRASIPWASTADSAPGPAIPRRTASERRRPARRVATSGGHPRWTSGAGAALHGGAEDHENGETSEYSRRT
ncbi:hypothetical protein ACWDBD_50430 [Streptomyces sp. NPDC001118]